MGVLAVIVGVGLDGQVGLVAGLGRLALEISGGAALLLQGVGGGAHPILQRQEQPWQRCRQPQQGPGAPSPGRPRTARRLRPPSRAAVQQRRDRRGEGAPAPLA
jgi:hypothetical protein